ncbi:TIGR03620 family F420-dependent LLM class oxidoreductase [Asanoa siamensis]|uniref:LLM class F420-dependent oxidoreductase n=1 Tax=Asanoa siamensis TaxID=926357 RepID=A0ABQ4CP21_9ACTN|nr:TIGR03620 family F420-dependent LLM class oxidoreductase [Asanoa siamensis]GIF73048.1 LLM class F420-dependent oxidoreductase [Asanoa siamensis]
MNLGRVGIWSPELRFGPAEASAEAAAELDEAGFRAIWLPGFGRNSDLFQVSENHLRSTTRAVVITAVLGIFGASPAESAANHVRLRGAYDGRFVLGLGWSSAETARKVGGRTVLRPVQDVAEYLDALDGQVPPGERLLAALGPRMARLGAERTLGIHPFLVTPEYAASIRPIIGDRALLAPHVPVVFSRDPREVRARARDLMAPFFGMPTYGGNLLRQGFTEDDLTHGGTDRLVDALTAWGDADSIAARLRAHLDAGADHVAVQILGGGPGYPRAEWRELAALTERLA